MSAQDQELRWDEIPQMFTYLKEAGVNDPDVDMFVAVFANDTQALKDALAAGADTSVTDREVLSKYRDKLEEFEGDRSGPGLESYLAPTEEELAMFMRRADEVVGGKAGSTVEHFGRAAMAGSDEDRRLFRRLVKMLNLSDR